MPNRGHDYLYIASHIAKHFGGITLLSHEGNWLAQAPTELMAMYIDEPTQLWRIAPQIGRGPRSAVTAFAKYIHDLTFEDQVCFVRTDFVHAGSGNVLVTRGVPFVLDGLGTLHLSYNLRRVDPNSQFQITPIGQIIAVRKTKTKS